LALLCLLALLLAGCPTTTVRPPIERLPDAAAAERLVRDGKSREAAEMFERLAIRATGTEQADFYLRATEQWLAAGARADAERVLALVSGTLPQDQAVTRALLVADAALAAGDSKRALQSLRDMPPPSTPAVAVRTLALQARAHFAAGDAAAGVDALLARERWLSGSAELAANRRMIVEGLRSSSAHGAVFTPPAGANPLLAGWLDLGALLLAIERNPFAAAPSIRNWRSRYPLHPANGALLDDLLRESAVSLEYPSQVAIMLPLSGRQQSAAIAVRDGFLSAYFQQEAAQRPRVRIYDIGGQDIASAYLRAVDEGAQFVVGPLTKDEVNGIASVADGRSRSSRSTFSRTSARRRQAYQPALVPGDEARQVADRIVGWRSRGVALLRWGTNCCLVPELIARRQLWRAAYAWSESDHAPNQQSCGRQPRAPCAAVERAGNETRVRAAPPRRCRVHFHRGPALAEPPHPPATAISLRERHPDLFDLGCIRAR
jgi:outer membrane PBP1 activator LpoA protein